MQGFSWAVSVVNKSRFYWKIRTWEGAEQLLTQQTIFCIIHVLFID